MSIVMVTRSTGISKCSPHYWVCKNQTPTGTPARCRLCGASIIIPPPVIHMGKWTGRTATLPGMGLSAKRHYELQYETFFAEALANEGFMGARE